VVAVGATYLRIISWNFVFAGLIFTFSGAFQALGNTWPSLISSASRLVTFVLPALCLSYQPDFTLKKVWYLSVATVMLQALTSFLLLRREMQRKLPQGAALTPATAAPAAPGGSGG
jgi:Na+-driven multidrug efflux pump